MGAPATADVFLFEGFRLDRSGLSRRDHNGTFIPIVIGSRALDVLHTLVERSGELVSRDEILDAVWPGSVVEGSNLPVQIAALRRVLDRERADGSCIQTIAGRGYRFVPPVKSEPAEAGLPLPDKPSIAVLPFANLSGDPEQEYFADGMVEEIITALSRIRWLFVIARNSSFTYKGQAVDVKQMGRELGVRYVLEGSVRKAASRVRITAQLIDASTGTHLWADRFDGSLEEVFKLQDEVASGVAGVIEPALQAAEAARSGNRPTAQLTAYDLYLRALAHSLSYEKDQLIRAHELLAQAIDRDPHYGPALALAGHCHQRFAVMSWTADPEAVRRTSVDLARQALRFSPDEPDVLALAGFTFGYFGEDIDVAIGLIDRCLTLNPSSARGWYWGGLLRVFAGQPDLALENFAIYLRLNPRDRPAPYLNSIGEAYFFGRRFDEAAVNLRTSLERAPGFPITYRVLASCYVHMGRLDDARQIIARLRPITPVVMETAIRYRNPELRELFLSGLRLAAGEAS
jgi:adenylate cyclase